MDSKLLAIPLAVVVLLSASLASAGEPSAADKETARGLMAEGRADRDKGDLNAAVKAFAGADALMHVPTTGLELARALAAVGQLVEARDTALRVMRLPEKPNEPAPFKPARDAASALNDELGVRIPSLTINLKNVPEGMTPSLAIDGASVPAEVLGQPRKLDPGHHVVTAKAGTATASLDADLAEKDSKELTIELPAQSAEAKRDVDNGAPINGPDDSGRGNKLLIFGGFGLAGAGVIAGSISGVLAISQANAIRGDSSSCQNGGTVCNPSIDGKLSDGKTMATVSTVSFIVAGVGAALGITGLFVGGGSSHGGGPSEAPAADQSSARVVPWIGLGSAGLSGTF